MWGDRINEMGGGTERELYEEGTLGDASTGAEKVTEDEYITVSDLTRVRMARSILEATTQYPALDFRPARIALGALEDKLFAQMGELDVTE